MQGQAVNIISLLGLAMSAGVLIVGLYSSTNNIFIFFDLPSAFIVLGGTLAATSIAFQLTRLGSLIKVFIIRIIKGKTFSYVDTIRDLMKIGELYQTNPAQLNNFLAKNPDHFLKEAIEMMMEGFLEKERLIKILSSRAESMYQYYISDANRFKTIAKFPPAFGMMGTTIGMIVLLGNLSGADAAKTIGPAMGICLITTLYGVALANLLVIPIAENLVANAKEIRIKNMIIIEGIKLIHEQTNSVILAEELNSFLLPGDRVNRKEIIKAYA
jgi:chemotaxis protein MotA